MTRTSFGLLWIVIQFLEGARLDVSQDGLYVYPCTSSDPECLYTFVSSRTYVGQKNCTDVLWPCNRRPAWVLYLVEVTGRPRSKMLLYTGRKVIFTWCRDRPPRS